MRNRYGNSPKQAAYENAYDCMCYGISRKDWNSCGISEAEADEVWIAAFVDITRIF